MIRSSAAAPLPARGLSRRDFVQLAASAAVGCLARTKLAAAPAPPPSPPAVIVGAHPWVYASRQPKYDITPVLPQAFADLSWAGMAGIELIHTALRPDDAVARIGELSRRHQLPVIGMSFEGVMWNREMHQAVLDDARLLIPRLAALGGKTLGTSVGPIRWGQKIRKTPQQFDDQAALLRQLMSLCQDHGVLLNLHNHTYEVENDLHDLKGTLARIPEIKLGPDLNWMIRAGVDPVWFIHEYHEHLVLLHLRDQTKAGRWVESVGEGDTDFAAIGRALHEVNFAGVANIELAYEKDFTPTRPLRENFKLSRETVRRTMDY